MKCYWPEEPDRNVVGGDMGPTPLPAAESSGPKLAAS